uniref:FBD domain-containing protein n=1 Tax=Lotus japonicus TaxID=34305 RepID=I3SP59_LOTJA|nr:unknown [Lotus japonicus]
MNLKQLEVSWGIYYWDRLITFLHHCPQLEQLIICKDTLTSPKPQHEWNPIPDTPLEHLKFFCMKNYVGSDIELEIIGYVLKNAIMSETLKIYFAGSLPSNKVRDQIVKSLSKLPTTSKNCHVLLLA